MVPGRRRCDDGSVVHGELYHLHDPDTTWPWLDAFEGVTRGVTSVTEPDAYVRTTVTATGPEGSAAGWIYLYSRPTDGLERIVSGIWHL